LSQNIRSKPHLLSIRKQGRLKLQGKKCKKSERRMVQPLVANNIQKERECR